MVDGNFENPETGARGAHLHLQIPAVRFFAHPEFLERIAANGAEGRHVGVAHAVQDRQYPAGETSRENLLQVHAAGLALPAGARTDHEIVRAARDRLDQLRNEFGAIAAVAVEKYHNVALRRNRAHTRGTGATVSAYGLAHHPGAGGTCDCSRSIRAAVVGHDYLVRNGRGKTFAHNVRDWFFLVERRDNDGNEHYRNTSHAAVK